MKPASGGTGAGVAPCGFGHPADVRNATIPGTRSGCSGRVGS
ncbi:MAG: hypothetical protein ACK56I_07450 [bacterium]